MEMIEDVLKAFRDAIKREGRTRQWVAKEMELNYFTVGKILNGDLPLTETNRKRLNELLGTDFGNDKIGP